MTKTNVSEKIQSLDAKALAELLKEVKLYKVLTKQLGNRGQAQFIRNLQGKELYVVEYFSTVSTDLAWEQAQVVYKKSFGLEIQKENVEFIINDTLKGGIKVYKDDSMVDLSFSKIVTSVMK